MQEAYIHLNAEHLLGAFHYASLFHEVAIESFQLKNCGVRQDSASQVSSDLLAEIHSFQIAEGVICIERAWSERERRRSRDVTGP